MGFSVPSTLPAPPAYGLPPNVIRASYALNLIQSDAFQFATSRRRVLNLFTIAPLPGGGSSARVADGFFYPLPTASGTIEIILYGGGVDVEISAVTSGITVTISASAPDVYRDQLMGISNSPEQLRISVVDRGGGFLSALFIYEASLTAAQLP